MIRVLPRIPNINKRKKRDKAFDRLLRMSSYIDTRAGSSPLGILERLPREIRDVVYEKVSKP